MSLMSNEEWQHLSVMNNMPILMIKNTLGKTRILKIESFISGQDGRLY